MVCLGSYLRRPGVDRPLARKTAALLRRRVSIPALLDALALNTVVGHKKNGNIMEDHGITHGFGCLMISVYDIYIYDCMNIFTL